MTAATINFDDGAIYEAMMGRWSHLVGEAFLDWLAPPTGLLWTDIGCGNGAFTQLLIDCCAPAHVIGVDPSQAQLAFASGRLSEGAATLRQGDAMALPVADASCDIAVMALVVFFIPDPAKGVAEMKRVLKPGGVGAAYVWDAVNGGGPSQAISDQLRGMGKAPPAPPRIDVSTPDGLLRLWTDAGFADIEARVIRVRRTFTDFDDYWSTTIKAPNLRPIISVLAPAEIELLKSQVRGQVTTEAGGHVSIDARANAIKGRRPD